MGYVFFATCFVITVTIIITITSITVIATTTILIAAGPAGATERIPSERHIGDLHQAQVPLLGPVARSFSFTGLIFSPFQWIFEMD